MPTAMMRKRVGGILLVGYSVAGEETVIVAPELNVSFDIGKAPQEAVCMDHLCISHGHPDHVAGLHYYFTQRWFLDNSTGTAYVPERLYQPFEELMRVWERIEGRYTQADIVIARPGVEIPIRRDLRLIPFEVNHRVDALGYSVIEVRHKLKPEFVGKSGPELVALKKSGVEIEYRLDVPLVAYCGDTAGGDFLDLDCVRNARVLLLECTFFDYEHVGRARAGDHIHIKDLPAIMPRLRNPHIQLIHLSRRNPLPVAKRQLAEILSPEDLDRVSLFMERPPKKSAQRNSNP